MIWLDTETTGLRSHMAKLHTCVFTRDENVAWNGMLVDLFSTPGEPIVGHNIRFDMKFLSSAGYDVFKNPWYDTLTLAQLLDENRPSLGLKDLSLAILGPSSLSNKMELDKAMDRANVKTVDRLCLADLAEGGRYKDTIVRYCKEDVDNARELWHVLYAQLQEKHEAMVKMGYKKTVAHYYAEECVPLDPVLAKMELRGMRIDTSRLLAFRDRLELDSKAAEEKLSLASKEVEAIEDSLYEAAVADRKSTRGKMQVERKSERYKTAFNWSSNQHVGKLLYDKLNAPPQVRKKTASGQWDVSEEQLQLMHNSVRKETQLWQVLDIFLGYKKIQKLLSTYTGEDKGLASHIFEGRIYPDFISGGGPVTGRLASRSPNVQTWPRDYPEIKRCFIPDTEDHAFAYFDYSQIELRVIAHLANCKPLIAAYNKGIDMHSLTAELMGVDRPTAKVLNFAMIYGASAYRLVQEFNGEKTVEDCEAFIQDFFYAYPEIRKFHQSTEQFARMNGYVVSDFGRVRRLPEAKSGNYKDREYKHAIRQAINFRVQSFAASICKRTMIALDKAGFELVTQIHDAVIVQLHKKDIGRLSEIQAIAEGIVKLSVPLIADCKCLNSFDEKDAYNEHDTN